jgi:hypothetical protein
VVGLLLGSRWWRVARAGPPSAAFALAWIDGWLAAYLVGCARVVARLPFAQLTSGPALLALVGVAALVWIVRRLRCAAGAARARPPRDRVGRARRVDVPGGA